MIRYESDKYKEQRLLAFFQLADYGSAGLSAGGTQSFYEVCKSGCGAYSVNGSL